METSLAETMVVRPGGMNQGLLPMTIIKVKKKVIYLPFIKLQGFVVRRACHYSMDMLCAISGSAPSIDCAALSMDLLLAQHSVDGAKIISNVTESANDVITSEIISISANVQLGAMLKRNNYFVMRMDNDDVIWTTFHASAIHAQRIATSSRRK
jgi:hypothetical protein